MRVARPITTTAARWLARGGVAVVGAVLLALLLPAAGARGLLGDGAAYTLATYDLVLPLVGLGLALAPLTGWPTLLAFIVVAVGVPVGILGEHRFAAALTLESDATSRLVFVGPFCCLVVGVALAPAGGLRLWVLPVAGALCGAALGFLIAFHDPAPADNRFAVGAAGAGLWLVVAPAAVLRGLDRAWLKIGGRIFASWLVAIGLLLGGSKYVAQQRFQRALAVPPAPVSPSYQPPPVNAPAIGEAPAASGRPRQWDDPSQQP